MIDFTPTHVRRIPHLTLSGRVQADSLTLLTAGAVASCDAFFGDEPYVIDSLEVEEARTVAGELVHYEGRFHARAPGATA